VCELRFLEFSGPRIFSSLHSGAWQLVETDCVAGHVGLELKNVGKNYPFERSRRFPGDKPNRGHRDYSRFSCGGGETQLGPSDGISAGFLARALGHRGALLQELMLS
jgi:hypothetical protein